MDHIQHYNSVKFIDIEFIKTKVKIFHLNPTKCVTML